MVLGYIGKEEFKGRDKKGFLEEMEFLWDRFEELGLDRIIGFEAICGQPIKVQYLIKEKVIRNGKNKNEKRSKKESKDRRTKERAKAK